MKYASDMNIVDRRTQLAEPSQYLEQYKIELISYLKNALLYMFKKRFSRFAY